MRNLIIFFLFISSLSALGQLSTDLYFDSIVQSYEEIEDTLLVDKLNRIAFFSVIKSDEKGVFIARKTRKIARSKGYFVRETDAINIIGIDFDINGKFDSSAYYFNLYLANSELLNDSTRMGRALNNLGMLHWHLGDFNKAIELFYRNLEISDKMGMVLGVGIASSNIGLLYNDLNQYDKALVYSKKAYKIRKQLNDTSQLGASCNNIGICFKNMKQYDSALFYYNEGVAYAEAVNSPRQLSELISNLGNLYILKDEIEKGYKLLKKSLEFKQSESAKESVYNSLSEVAFSLNRSNEALEYALKALASSTKDVGYGRLQYDYLQLANAYYLNKEYEKAHEYYLKWGEAKDSVYSTENTKALADFEIRYQTEKKEKEIARQELEIAEMDLMLYNRNKVLIGLGVVVLALVFFGLYIIQYRKRKAQHEKDEAIIKEKNKGLAAIIQVQEDERKRIAKDLHDGIVQQLGGLKLGLQKVFMDSETEESNKLLCILDDSAQELRELSHKMMPRSLSELGLIPALEDMLQNSLGNTDIKYQFENFGIIDRFDENIEIAIYRIAQELINNVIKHSQANRVNIQLFKTANDILLIVEDNGKGIGTLQHKEGIGLMNISSRLDTINGKVNFEPSPESGTLATIKIPIQQ